ncbi:hypothetical protein QIA36_00380 (plasmid) [Borreliella yangtzensis]|uniref:hypothetical protein n=1 Tax=Borreliella yangtzensis TaxID=683292 RepID=UPI002649D685|nr:hypothetical protein [Borreliella yangtzensis]WKC74810.1 hypothetical protein QIA36_00380 [Borreliella yangtzensis]
MKSRFFYICLFSALIFIFSCDLKSGSKLTDKQKSKILKTIKSRLGNDPKKIARVDEYFNQFDDSKRDVVLHLFSIAFEYIDSKESEKESANKAALKSDFESKLKQLNYTVEDFERLTEEFDNFVDPKTK